LAKTIPNTILDINSQTTRIIFFRKVLVCIILSVLIIGLYRQVRNHDFINLDDAAYVTDNDLVKQGLSAKGIAETFTTTQA
jgi:hypothetical protein